VTLTSTWRGPPASRTDIAVDWTAALVEAVDTEAAAVVDLHIQYYNTFTVH